MCAKPGPRSKGEAEPPDKNIFQYAGSRAIQVGKVLGDLVVQFKIPLILVVAVSVIAVVLVSGYDIRTLYVALYPTPTVTPTLTPTSTPLPTQTANPTLTPTPTLTPSITPPPGAKETPLSVKALPACSSQVVGVQTAEMTDVYVEIPESGRMELVDFSLNTHQSSFLEADSGDLKEYSCCYIPPGPECFEQLDANRLFNALQDYANSSGKRSLLAYISTTQELMRLLIEKPGIANQLIPGLDEWRSLSPEDCNVMQSWLYACTMLESPVFTVVIKNNSDERVLITKILYRVEEIYEMRAGGYGVLDPQVTYIHNIHYAAGDQVIKLENKFYIDPHLSGSFDLQLRTDDPGDGLSWRMSIYFIDENGATVHTDIFDLIMSGPPN